jgi:hypothetical protein
MTMANKYFLSHLLPDYYHAAGTLREDIETTLLRLGYEKVAFSSDRSLYGKTLRFKQLLFAFWLMRKADVVFFHFPLRSTVSLIILVFLKLRKKSKSIGYVHDFEGIRDGIPSLLDRELKELSRFDVVIAHNETMRKWLEEKLQHQRVVSLQLYDYLFSEPTKREIGLSFEVAFAGNFEKAPFVKKLDELASGNLKFHLYGSHFHAIQSENVVYHGVLDPRRMTSDMKGSFGLVWDGTELATCAGNTGQYLRYNNPHKLSLYLAAGLPVIVWNESAVASWIDERKLGVTVSSLFELEEKIKNISQEGYDNMSGNVLRISQLLQKGHFFENTMKETECLMGIV